MHEVADDVWQIPLAPRSAMNAYLVGDVLVDAGTMGSARKILRAIAGRPVRAHALTHAHGDHAGGSNRVAAALDVPVWVGDRDADALQRGVPEARSGPAGAVLRRVGRWKPVTPARTLHEGEELAPGWTVLHAPGHSPGHLAFWREDDRTLVCGDVFFNISLLTLRSGLHEPPAVFTPDVPCNRESARRLAALDPATVCFGHGPVLRDSGALAAFAARLP